MISIIYKVNNATTTFLSSFIVRTCCKKLRFYVHYYHELAYETSGKPWSCIKYYKCSSDEFNKKIEEKDIEHLFRSKIWVHVEMIAAPYNPADALSIQGLYPNPYNNNNNNNANNNDGEGLFNHNNNNNNNNNNAYYEELARTSRRSVVICNTGTVPGSEGWGRIIDIIRTKKNTTTDTNTNHTLQASAREKKEEEEEVEEETLLNIGDYVVMGQPGLGTFRSNMWLPSTSVIKLQYGSQLYTKYGPTIPAPLFQTAGTALRMIRDFVVEQPSSNTTKVKKDDNSNTTSTTTIVQNAGNSAVGLMVSQIATKMMHYNCISIIRSAHRTHQAIEEVQQYMIKYGNPTYIITEDSIRESENIQNLVPPHGDIRNIRLGLNAVGGDSIHTLLRMMSSSSSLNRSTVVTYGNMSKQSFNPSILIFNNMNFTGFWYSRWMVQQQLQHQQHSRSSRRIQNEATTNDDDDNVPLQQSDLRSVMMNEIVDAVLDGTLKCPPVQVYPLRDYKIAFEQSKSPKNIKPKIVFDCRL